MYNKTRSIKQGRSTVEKAYNLMVTKVNVLKDRGHAVTPEWEYERKKELKENKQMKHFFDAVRIAEPLDAREGRYFFQCNS